MQAIFDLMKARLEHPDMAFFSHYRDDFFVHDYRELVLWGAESASYLWFVRESGSDIIRLQVCNKHAERGQALLDLHDWSRGKIFHLRGSHPGARPGPILTEVDVQRARSLIEEPPTYHRSAGVVTHVQNGVRSEIARLRIVWERGWATSPKAAIKCDMFAPNIEHVTALRLLAMAEVVEQSGSLFTPIQSIAINGEDISDHTARLRQDAGSCNPKPPRRPSRLARSTTAATT